MSFPGLIFLLFFLSFAVLSFARNPVYGLYLYVAVFYLDPPSRWWGALLPDLRWSLLAAGVTCVSLLFERSSRTRSPWRKAPAALFLVYVAYMWAQTPWAVDPEEHWHGLFIFSKYLIVIYMVHAVVNTRERLAGFLLAHALGCLYLGLVAWSVGGGGRLDGVGGPGIDDANSLAMQLATGVYAAAAFYFAERSRLRYVPILIAPFVLNGFVMAGSRGGFLALIAGGLTFFLMRPARTLRVVITSAVLGIGLLGYLTTDFFWTRISTIETAIDKPEEVDQSTATRMLLFRAQWQMALDHPLGAGHAGTTGLSYQYVPIQYHSGQYGRSSHNTLMSSLVDQGFLGLAAWVAIMALIWSRLHANRAWANRHSDTYFGWLNAALAAMFVVVIVAGMFAPLIRTEVYVWILALACCSDQFRSVATQSTEQHSESRTAPTLQPRHPRHASFLRGSSDPK